MELKNARRQSSASIPSAHHQGCCLFVLRFIILTGWAEPLLEEIRKNPRTIIQPEVDQIEAMSLEYIGAAGVVPRGGFSWDLR